eukprot:gene2345-54578_t
MEYGERKRTGKTASDLPRKLEPNRLTADGRPPMHAVRSHGKLRWEAIPARYITVCDPATPHHTGCAACDAGGCGLVNRPGNRDMVNRINAGSAWQAQPLHTTRVFRHGITLVTRRRRPAFDRAPAPLPAPCRAHGDKYLLHNCGGDVAALVAAALAYHLPHLMYKWATLRMGVRPARVALLHASRALRDTVVGA